MLKPSRCRFVWIDFLPSGCILNSQCSYWMCACTHECVQLFDEKLSPICWQRRSYLPWNITDGNVNLLFIKFMILFHEIWLEIKVLPLSLSLSLSTDKYIYHIEFIAIIVGFDGWLFWHRHGFVYIIFDEMPSSKYVRVFGNLALKDVVFNTDCTPNISSECWMSLAWMLMLFFISFKIK